MIKFHKAGESASREPGANGAGGDPSAHGPSRAIGLGLARQRAVRGLKGLGRRWWRAAKNLRLEASPAAKSSGTGATQGATSAPIAHASFDFSTEHAGKVRDLAGTTPRNYAFLVSTTEHARKIHTMAGAANYSYFFVYKYFEKLLERFGPCRLVDDPRRDLAHAANIARRDGYTPIHLSFNPPHEAHADPGVPTILMPQWEFPEIPDRALGGDESQNWVRACNASDLIVVSSGFTGDAFRRPDIHRPIALVPIPLAPAYGQLPDWDPNHNWTLICRHKVYGGGEAKRPQPPAPALPPPSPLTLCGFVYTSVFNLCDQRKNYVDMLSAFLRAFHDRPDVTLVLKLNVPTCREDEDFGIFNHIYYTLNIKHACNVVVITDYFQEAQLLELIRVTTFYVSTSKAEGANMILQQALAAGRPSVAPVNTAMIDYMDDQVGFVVGSHPEPAHWPHDPEHCFETIWHRLVWSDLRDQYLASLATLENNPGRYAEMAKAARQRIANYAGHARVAEAFRDALKLLPQAQDDAPSQSPAAPAARDFSLAH